MRIVLASQTVFGKIKTSAGFVRCFRDPIRVPRIENWVPRIRDNIIGSLELEKIESLESEKSGPYRSIPAT